jgi:colanic acid/amylovoran biosynthesis protein
MIDSMKVVIINHVNSLNLGDSSIIYSTINTINSALKPDKIFLMSFAPEFDQNLYFSRSVEILPSPSREANGRFGRCSIIIDMFLFFLWSLILRSTGKNISFLTRNKEVCNAFVNSDLIIVRGGDNLADTYGNLSIIQHLYNLFLALIIRKRVLILSVSIGPFKNRFWKWLLYGMLKKVDCVIVRDLGSKNTLVGEGKLNKNMVFFIPDIAFLLPAKRHKGYDKLFKKQKICVGLVPSKILYDHFSKNNKDYTTLFARLGDLIVEQYTANVFLIPHVLYPKFGDRELAAEIFNKMRRKKEVVIVYNKNPMEIKYLISKLNLIISPRMHPIIHALSTGVPVIGIDYNIKTKEVMKLFGLEKWVLEMKTLNFECLKTKVQEIFPRLDEISFHIASAKIKDISEYRKLLKQFK